MKPKLLAPRRDCQAMLEAVPQPAEQDGIGASLIREAVAKELERLKSTWLNPKLLSNTDAEKVLGKCIEREYALTDLLRRPDVSYASLMTLPGAGEPVPRRVHYYIAEEFQPLRLNVKRMCLSIVATIHDPAVVDSQGLPHGPARYGVLAADELPSLDAHGTPREPVLDAHAA